MSIIDSAKAEYLCTNGQRAEGLKLYQQVIEQLEEKDKRIAMSNFVLHSFAEGRELASKGKWVEALDTYKAVLNYTNFPIVTYKNIGLCLKAMKNFTAAITLFELYEKDTSDKYDALINLGEMYYKGLNNMEKAIEYYEKAIEYNKEDCSIWNMLGHLYSTFYRDSHEEEQIRYLKGAYDRNPKDKIIVKNLAYVLGKFNRIEEADKYYSELMNLNPLHSDLHSYGAYLVRHKRFKEGFKYLRHRFQKEDIKSCVFPSMFFGPKGWKVGKSIKNKNVLLHSEQGFGDTLLFARYAMLLKEKCKSVTIAVQKGLYPLYKVVGLEGIKVLEAGGLSDTEFDVVIPMMDLPLVCKTTPDNIPLSEGYLNVPLAYVEEYKEKYIKDDKLFRIGVAFEGSALSVETQRDIPLAELYSLMQLPNVQVYCFQVGELTNQIPKVPKEYNFTPLGHTFKNWLDTAAAMKNMDLIVTTDNGVMNLAGSLGMRTFGLFNSLTEWRWFKTEGEDVGWYKSIKPFKCKTHNEWKPVIERVLDEVRALIE